MQLTNDPEAQKMLAGCGCLVILFFIFALWFTNPDRGLSPAEREQQIAKEQEEYRKRREEERFAQEVYDDTKHLWREVREYGE